MNETAWKFWLEIYMAFPPSSFLSRRQLEMLWNAYVLHGMIRASVGNKVRYLPSETRSSIRDYLRIATGRQNMNLMRMVCVAHAMRASELAPSVVVPGSLPYGMDTRWGLFGTTGHFAQQNGMTHQAFYTLTSPAVALAMYMAHIGGGLRLISRLDHRGIRLLAANRDFDFAIGIVKREGTTEDNWAARSAATAYVGATPKGSLERRVTELFRVLDRGIEWPEWPSWEAPL